MGTKRKILLTRIRWLTILLAGGVTFFAAAFLLSGTPAFAHAAMLTAIWGLCVVSLLVERAIRV